jgi:hypothetical protein
MTESFGPWVPKVHPATRGVEADDPLELRATPAGGDPEVMLECLLQEFAGMGWDEEGLLSLFRSPAYPLLNELREHFGEAEVARRARALLESCGVFRFTESFVEEPEPDEGPELIQVSVAKLARGG